METCLTCPHSGVLQSGALTSVISHITAVDLKHLGVTGIIETSYSVVTSLLLYCYRTCLFFQDPVTKRP